MSEPTCRELCYSGADCLSNIRSYLPGTVLQWCRLFKRCQNLPASHCLTVVQTCLSCVGTYLPGTVLSGAGFLSGVRTYLPGTVLQWCRLGADCLNRVRTYLPGIVLQWCRLFKQCHKLPAGHCVAVVQDI